MVREEAVRLQFDRIGFDSAGQEPVVMDMQKRLHSQLVGEPMEPKPTATAASQRQQLEGTHARGPSVVHSACARAQALGTMSSMCLIVVTQQQSPNCGLRSASKSKLSAKAP